MFIMMSDIGAHAYTIMGTFVNDEMGYSTSLTGWGPTACTEVGRFFAPPRSFLQFNFYRQKNIVCAHA
jgi:hypothetical protein